MGLQLLVNKTEKNLQIENKKLSFRLVIDRLLKNSSQRVMLRPRAMSSSSSGSLQERKNIPCRHWVNKGHCDLGSDCKFSHESSGVLQRRLCKIFTATGKCPHGQSCHFLPWLARNVRSQARQ